MSEYDGTSGVHRFDMTPLETESIPREGSITPFAVVFRHLNVHGPFTHRFNARGVVPDTAVTASITEVDANRKPFIGNAGMAIGNVAPGDGFVDVHGQVDYDRNVTVRVTILTF
jgi:hypothetical protein